MYYYKFPYSFQILVMQRGLAHALCAHVQRKVLYVNLWKSRTASIWPSLSLPKLSWMIMYAKYSVLLHLEHFLLWKLVTTRSDSAKDFVTYGQDYEIKYSTLKALESVIYWYHVTLEELSKTCHFSLNILQDLY